MPTIRATQPVPIGDLVEHPENPNQGDAGAISLSLQRHGQYRAIVVSEATITTLIACQNLGRVCHAVELDPAYCDVIVKRWETLTGETANLME